MDRDYSVSRKLQLPVIVTPVAFYHAWADGFWKAPVTEYLEAVREAGFPAVMYWGVTGDRYMREYFRFWLTKNADGLENEIAVEADTGYEQVTLRAVREFAKSSPETAVLYTHAKGSYTVDPVNDRWLRSMNSLLIGQWRKCVKLLESGYDAVGPHWLVPGVTYEHQQPYWEIRSPFFGGNFWWARSDYLARLPEPDYDSRYSAEAWIGTGNPEVYDLSPGWPHY